MAVAYRYRCCNLSHNALRGSQISTPYNIDEVDLNGARFRSTSHNDAAFVERTAIGRPVGFPRNRAVAIGRASARVEPFLSRTVSRDRRNRLLSSRAGPREHYADVPTPRVADPVHRFIDPEGGQHVGALQGRSSSTVVQVLASTNRLGHITADGPVTTHRAANATRRLSTSCRSFISSSCAA
jgi:hypothetical protein